jgi:hypothetical protein
MTEKKKTVWFIVKRKAQSIAKRITLPGFEGENVYDVFAFFLMK